ncbi:unnamed protein product [Blepharisma stoltei]|uniref:PAS domain-containing protein n=1 Tax=Blepharisma stoltei TaxID=1481888 RepID=A0AAU9J3S7_9CILI|nr:unnamed protein product [Blepharisma stoltei]
MSMESAGSKQPCFTKSMLLEFLLPSIENHFQEETRSWLTNLYGNTWISFIFFSVLSASLWHFWNETIALSVISLVPFFEHKNLNVHFKRLIAEFACIQFHIRNIETSNLCENIGVFFPCFCLTFLCIKQWKYTLFYSVFEAIVVFCYTGQNIYGMIFTTIFYTIISAIFEKDFRDIWTLYAITKNKAEELKIVLDTSHSAIYVLDKEGNINYYNAKALSIAKMNGKSSDFLQFCKFQDIFDEDFSSWAKSTFTKSLKQDIGNEEFMVFKNITDINPEGIQNIGFDVRTDSVKWDNKESIRVAFIDVSLGVLNRLLLIRSYKSLEILVDQLLKKLLKIFRKEQLYNTKVFAGINLLKTELKGLLLFQGYYLRKVEFKSDFFDFFVEIHNVIEMLFHRASQKQISISLIRSSEYPTSLFGDNTLYSFLLNALLRFLLEKSDNASELTISIVPKFVNKNEYLLEHYIEFSSHSTSQEELDDIFQIKKETAKRKSLVDMMRIMKENGTCLFMFDPLICLLRGYTNFTFSKDDNTGLFNLFIPFTASEKELDTKKIDITHQCFIENENYSKWYIF